MRISGNTVKSVVPIWSELIMQNCLPCALSSVTSAPAGSWFGGENQGVTSWMSSTVSPPTQGNAAPSTSSGARPGRSEAEVADRGVMLDVGAVGALRCSSEQLARAPIPTSVSRPGRKARDILPSVGDGG